MVFASFYPETFPARRFKSSQYQGLSTAPRGGELHLASTFFSSHHLPDGLWTSAEMKFGPTSESRPDRKFFGAKCWNFLEKGSKMAKMVVFRRFFLFSPPCLAEKFQPMYLGFFCLFLGDYPLGPAASRPNPPPQPLYASTFGGFSSQRLFQLSRGTPGQYTENSSPWTCRRNSNNTPFWPFHWLSRTTPNYAHPKHPFSPPSAGTLIPLQASASKKVTCFSVFNFFLHLHFDFPARYVFVIVPPVLVLQTREVAKAEFAIHNKAFRTGVWHVCMRRRCLSIHRM